jgi:hypothetical protein
MTPRTIEQIQAEIDAEEPTWRRVYVPKPTPTPAPAAPPSVDEQPVTGAMLTRVLHNVAQATVAEVSKAIAPFEKRCAELERRCRDLEARSGVNITAQGLTMNVPGLEAVAGVIERLEAAFHKPIQPVYDKDGNLLGARRVETLGDETTETRVAPQLVKRGRDAA